MSSPLINLEKYHIILASNSPRRKELLKGLGIIFQIRASNELDESFPHDLHPASVAEFLAQKKAAHYKKSMADNELIITADTVVISGSDILNKPANREEAIDMLTLLSGKTHEVITGVCLTTKHKQVAFSTVSDVTFCRLTPEETAFYVDNYRPFDKAGAYGIQEWIGFIGVEKINGSFYNVMGLPVQKLYQELKKF
ncbi:Maf-like protein [Saccharicrinis sp. FJH2]|uniref:Maf-like protein n=1 Tax=Saccharicrinis sp. FJH65 TaxID=3344659 RepID=UPI0035F40FD7